MPGQRRFNVDVIDRNQPRLSDNDSAFDRRTARIRFQFQPDAVDVRFAFFVTFFNCPAAVCCKLQRVHEVRLA